MTSFLEKDLPAIIRYIDGRLSLIQNMSEVKWTEQFTVIQTNVGSNEEPKQNNGISENHWIKKEVEKYYIPKGPLKNFYVSQRVKEDIVDSFKRAIQWSTKYGSSNVIDPDALVFNLIHQLFGMGEEELNITNSQAKLNLEKNVIEINRYFIEYTTKEAPDVICSFVSKAPNAELARMEFHNEIKGNTTIQSVGKIIEIEMDVIDEIFRGDVKYTFAVVYRLRHESNYRLCYFKTKEQDVISAMTDFINQYPEAIVKHLTEVVETEKF